jgi:hypothetical protein
VFVESSSLRVFSFFGPDDEEAGGIVKSILTERQTIAGGNAVLPVTRVARALRPSIVAGINERLITVDGMFDTTPPVANPPLFTELNGGVRVKPSPFNARLRMNYLVQFQQFLASRESRASFRRWTVDLRHEIPLYRNVSTFAPRDANGPDDCAQSIGTSACPPVSTSRNREGAISLRLLGITSATGSGAQVPLYFQPTLGGSDINGQRLLSSYEDYRFRGPHLLALQESVEHSVWGPLGVWFLAEQGRVGLQRSDLHLDNLAHSFSAGVTVRAGGFPVMTLSFAWGGGGHHVLAAMDSSLLGGSRRPSLY